MAGTDPPPIAELSNKEAAERKPDERDLVKITGTVVERTNCLFVLDDGSGSLVYGFLYRDVATPHNPAKLAERWSAWGHLQRVPFEPDDGPPLIWICPGHMTKLSP